MTISQDTRQQMLSSLYRLDSICSFIKAEDAAVAAGGGGGCGTGAGGFKPGNTCARGGGAGGEGGGGAAGVQEVDLHPALKKLKPAKGMLDRMEDHLKTVFDLHKRYNPDDADVPNAELRQRVNAKLKELLDGAQVRVRLSPEDFLLVLAEGRFKNQFETGTSNGALNQQYRREKEKERIGVGSRTTGENRPIYGYAVDGGTHPTNDTGTVRHYGRVIVDLHATVKNRSTVTLVDSLDDPTVATPMNNPDLRSMSAREYKLPDQYTRGTTMVEPYTEVQMFGGVSADDIKKVYLRAPDLTTRESELATHNAIIKKLTELGIPWETYTR